MRRSLASLRLVVAGLLAAGALSGCVVRSPIGFIPRPRPAPAAIEGGGGVVAVQPEDAGRDAGGGRQTQPQFGAGGP